MKIDLTFGKTEYFSCHNIKKFTVKFLLNICIVFIGKALYKSAFFAKDFNDKSEG